ncbi:MAG TPA: nucleotide sugar dehydrogenase [Bellilinea sp.]|nr:nucleotide sugar dehydrogenase [Bellilinea sp.]
MEKSVVCMLGMGYIGLPTALALTAKDIKVIGVDVSPEVRDSLQRGIVHIKEPGLSELLVNALSNGTLEITDQPREANVFFIAVPTPFYGDKQADMTYVRDAASSIVPHLRHGNLVLLESTSPPLTTKDLVQPILEQSGLKAGTDYYLAFSPERAYPGRILEEVIRNDRVVGGINATSAERAESFYRTFVEAEIVRTDATTAEMVKLMENTYRDVNIAIANEFSRLAERFGIDVWEAIKLANRHPRVKILQPGPGVGGHCISVDPWFLVEAAPDLTTLIRSARTVNDSQPRFAVTAIERALGGLEGKQIAALGLAFKPDVDDLRESPAIEVVKELKLAGASVKAYEPFKSDYEKDEVKSEKTLQNTLTNADAVVLLVRHKQFAELIPTEVAQQMPGRIAIDLVGGWNRADWEQAGFTFYSLGDGKN